MNKKRKYTFKRWLAHLCAFNMVALNLNVWRFRHLFHDIDKPIMNLFFNSEKVKRIHLSISPHHLEYKGSRLNFTDMIIDWECAKFTKPNSQLNARDTLELKILPKMREEGFSEQKITLFYMDIIILLKKFQL